MARPASAFRCRSLGASAQRFGFNGRLRWSAPGDRKSGARRCRNSRRSLLVAPRIIGCADGGADRQPCRMGHLHFPRGADGAARGGGLRPPGGGGGCGGWGAGACAFSAGEKGRPPPPPAGLLKTLRGGNKPKAGKPTTPRARGPPPPALAFLNDCGRRGRSVAAVLKSCVPTAGRCTSWPGFTILGVELQPAASIGAGVGIKVGISRPRVDGGHSRSGLSNLDK